mgnify:CR=1 FL=1
MNTKFKHQERHFVRQKEKGLVRVTIWCPVQSTPELKALGRELRNQHFKEQRGEA